MASPRVLIVDDDEDVLLALALLLRENGYVVVSDSDPARIPVLLGKTPFDAVFLDMNFRKDATDGEEGFSWMRKILAADPDVMVIPITAFGEMDLAIRAIKEGAADFILKPWNNEKLLSTLSMALALKNARKEIGRLRIQQKQILSDSANRFGEMIGKSRAMEKVFTLIRKVAGTDAHILILGENGTGKELVARELHRRSSRSARIFIGVDMGSIVENLFESELFGYVKGAFTDAKENRIGRFEIASGGTLFLDEIGNLIPSMQAKLLHAIEHKEITPVGSNEPKAVDIRLICATNMPLHDMVARKEFRQDLLFRINTIEISLPPLRERPEDIPLLVDYFAAFYCRKYKMKKKRISRKTLDALAQYRWPGNIRELKHAVERAAIIGETDEFRREDFFFSPIAPPAAGWGEALELEQIIKEAIVKSLARNGGNVSKSADELGLTRASLYRRLEKYGLRQLSR